ncbi:DeoR/GlpR family DNA-binding transcription regulator [Nocardioides coralli]|uniref:DeoR/GlpR family DNA-binding transcription regulator n=1 Tax=Nocardioides coralli TaxID=2872154 RepID=UPI001CA46A56|nr:DeoR/GlpR family DNA-binding transcription regulator [Nocardioides coralli]QZY28586.1 DeoR/GlpR family DNA-binding transcription regulator [Nocardioides coralli]
MTTQGPDQATRWRLLLDALAARRRLSVSEAAELLGVSAATVRRDFGELARRQLATRTHGGVVATSVAYDLPARYRTTSDDPRERIAAEAAGRIRVGTVVAFNGGTTTTAVARHLSARPDVQEAEADAVTIVTNALNIAGEMVLRPSIRTVVIGGVARPQSYELHGPFASRVLRDLLVDELFLGVDALNLQGASCHHLGESVINAEMAERAQRVTVVAAAHKLGRVSLSVICGLDRVQELITDREAPEDVVADLRAAGVEVTLV